MPDQAGYLDPDVSIKELTKSLADKRMFVKREDLEKALWACNMLDEISDPERLDETVEACFFESRRFFWLPDESETFEKFVERLTESKRGPDAVKFDRRYNLLLKRRKERKKVTNV